MNNVPTLANPDANAIDDADGWTAPYERMIQRLRLNGVGSGAPLPGALFPDLSLPDPSGTYRTLSELRAEGPIVVSFHRGLWCPYCSHELRSWAELLPSLTEAGVRLVIVAGELGERAEALRLLSGEDAIMLCDVDHGGALAAGLAFHLDHELKQRYRAAGLDLGAVYGSDGWFLPVPATYVIDAQGIVRFAFTNPDFRLRADPIHVATIAREVAGGNVGTGSEADFETDHSAGDANG